MIFADFTRERMLPALKLSLLSAALLTPLAALAESSVVSSETIPPPPFMVQSSLDLQITPNPAVIMDSANTIVPLVKSQTADHPKLASLSQHIQNTYKVSERKATSIVREAIKSAERHQVEPELILAIIAIESTFRERAVSRVGARGLMQVMPGVHREKLKHIGGPRALFDPAKNIHTGSQILVDYLNDHSGNLRRALLNYNGSLGMRSSFAERVIRVYRDFQKVTTPG